MFGKVFIYLRDNYNYNRIPKGIKRSEKDANLVLTHSPFVLFIIIEI